MWIERKEIERVLQEVVDKFLIPRFHELKMNASGEWLENLEVEATDDDKGYIKGRHYTEYLAKGRPPSDKLPPISALEKWVNVKLGISGEEATSIAFAIAHKIRREGTKWHQQGGTDLVEILESPEVITYIQNELGSILKVKISERLIRETKRILE